MTVADIELMSELTDNQFVRLPAPTSYEEAVQVGMSLSQRESATAWQIGWYADEIPTEYGKETLAVWCGACSLNPSTVRGYVSVAQAFKPRFVRDHQPLSFAHFKEARRLLPKKVNPDDPMLSSVYEEASNWLIKAVENGWSANRLRLEMFPNDDEQGPAPISITGEMYLEETGNGIAVVVHVSQNHEYIRRVLQEEGYIGQQISFTPKLAGEQ